MTSMEEAWRETIKAFHGNELHKAKAQLADAEERAADARARIWFLQTAARAVEAQVRLGTGE